MDSNAAAQDAADSRALTLLPPPRLLLPPPIGADAKTVRAWFDGAVATAEPAMDGTLGRRARRRRGLPPHGEGGQTPAAPTAPRCAPGATGAPGTTSLPCPPAGQDVAAFLAGERRRGTRRPTPSNCAAPRSATCTAPPAARCRPTMPASRRPSPASAATPPPRGDRRRKKVAATADHSAPAAGRHSRRSARPARPGHAAGGLRRRAAALGAGRHPRRASGEDRPRHAADHCRRPRARRPTP